MKSRHLTAMLWTILLFVVAQAQTDSGFPTLPPVPRTGQLTNDPTSTSFTFIAAGDNRPDGHTAKQPPTLAQILEDSKRFRPAFMLWSGDTIAGFRIAGQKMHHKELEEQYKEFFKIAARAGVPIFNSPGNHEMDLVEKSGKETIETPNAKMQELYLKMMEYPAGAPPYGAFNYGNSRFIAVDTEEVPTELVLRSPGKTVAKKLKLDPGFVSKKQIDLLESDLKANQDKAHIFVFMHHPINPAKKGSRLNKENADKLEKIFAKYTNVSFVLAAHEHLYYNAGNSTLTPASRTNPSSGGPGYIVSGGAGAPLDSCPTPQSQNCSASFHYLVFQVNGSSVDVQVVMVPAKLSKPKKKKS